MGLTDATSLVHNVHPSHAFLVVPDKESSTRSEPDMFPPFVEPPDPSDEECWLSFDSMSDVLIFPQS